VARYLARAGVRHLYGCDIDAEAVEWCAAHLPGDYRLTTPEPSLPFEAGELDVVIATSVFTHLPRDEQQRWLSELHRVLRPGGLLLASLAGSQAARVGRSARLASRRPGSVPTRLAALRRTLRVLRAGIVDAQLDPHLDGIAPAGYYRMVYQTASYTKRAWAPYFRLVTRTPRGLNGHQDLLVMCALEA